MDKLASQILEQFKDPAALKSILATAGASGLLGGFMTSQGAPRHGESKNQRRWRILRNALLTGAAGGGALALGRGGVKELNTALPVNDVDPVTSRVKSPGARAAYAGAGIAAAHGKDVLRPQGARKSLLDAILAQGGKGALGETTAKAIQQHGGLVPSLMQHDTHGGNIRKAIEATLINGHNVPGSEGAGALARDAAGIADPATASHVRRELIAAGLPAERATSSMGHAKNFGRAALYRAFGGSTKLTNPGMFRAPITRTALGSLAAFTPEVIGLGTDAVGTALSSRT